MARSFIGDQSWVPNELEHAGRENRDPEHATRYDLKEDAAAVQDVDYLCSAGIIKRESIVIDLGAGTGQFAVAACERAGHVVAVDISSVMLEQLQMKIERLGVSNVSCRLAGFLTYTHEGPPADLVYSRYALHHLPDFWKAMALMRMATFLRPGGRLRLWDVVYSFDPADAENTLGAWMNAFAPVGTSQEWVRSDLEEHIRDENSTFSWLLEPMLEKAGFAIEEAEYSADQIFAKYLCVRRSRG